MNDLNLFLKFTVAGDNQLHVRGASRIVIDGRGGLLLHDAQTHRTQRIDLAELRSLSIHAPSVSGQPRPTLAS